MAGLEFFMILIKNRLKKYYKYSNDHYSVFAAIFRQVIKNKTRGEQAPFMTKELRKAIMTRSKLGNAATKQPSHENFNAENISKKAETSYLEKSAVTGDNGSKKFWIQANPF